MRESGAVVPLLTSSGGGNFPVQARPWVPDWGSGFPLHRQRWTQQGVQDRFWGIFWNLFLNFFRKFFANCFWKLLEILLRKFFQKISKKNSKELLNKEKISQIKFRKISKKDLHVKKKRFDAFHHFVPLEQTKTRSGTRGQRQRAPLCPSTGSGANHVLKGRTAGRGGDGGDG